MMSFLAVWIAVFYVAPFLVIAAMPGWRSLGVVASLAAAAVTMLWISHLRHSGDGNGFALAMADFGIAMLTASVAAATIGRGVTLAGRRFFRRWRTFAVLVASFLAAPALYFGLSAYAEWKRRPPTVECAARQSFALRFGETVLRAPNTPMTMIRADDDIFSLAIPSGVRKLCAATDGAGGALAAQTITLFVEKAVRERKRPENQSWLANGCRTASPTLRRLICAAERASEIDQLTIYGKADFPNRVVSIGRAPSYEFFQQQKALGRYPPGSGERRGGAIVYPDGTWAMDDERSIVRCGSTYSYGRPCSVDVLLADGVNAKINFAVLDEDVEGAYRRVRATTLDLYGEWRAPGTPGD